MKKSFAIVFLYIYSVTASTTRTKFINLRVSKIHVGEEAAQRVVRDQGLRYKEQEKWVEEQQVVKRSLRSTIQERSENEPSQSDRRAKQFSKFKRICFKSQQNGQPLADSKLFCVWKERGSFNTIPTIRFSTKPSDKNLLFTYSGATNRLLWWSTNTRSPYLEVFNDPYWTHQWYVQDYRIGASPVMDHNVVPVYKMGITGRGVLVMVVDGEIEFNHPDLDENIDLSYDFCKNTFGCMTPHSEKQDSHATMCAGVIAMVADNKLCGVGIAYGANVAGARIHCLCSNDYIESKSLVHQLTAVDIYSCSWGDKDDGMTMDGIGSLRRKAINMGLETGRQGKGAVYVVAAGNGRSASDNCAADGLVNFVGTIPITSATHEGTITHYGERCTAVFATTYSSSSSTKEYSIVATAILGDCKPFGGTSASTAIATGIIALTLQANPELTYRDVMHLIAMTSEVAPLADNEDIWYRNGRGFWVSNDFGFGLLNAENLVIMAKKWKTVPEKKTCMLKKKLKPAERFKTSEIKTITIDTTGCLSSGNEEILFLEHIELSSTTKYPCRGAFWIRLRSPAGTESTLLEPRLNDNSRKGLDQWSIKSVHNWGEDPRGEWTVILTTVSLTRAENAVAEARLFTLTLHGTSEKPAHYDQPREYAAFRLPNGLTPWST